MQDRQLLLKIATGISEVYGKPFSEAMLEIWWRALEDWPDELVAKAIEAHIKDPERGSWAPVPADVIRHCTALARNQRMRSQNPLLRGPKEPMPKWVATWMSKFLQVSRDARAAGEKIPKEKISEILREAKAEREQEASRGG